MIGAGVVGLLAALNLRRRGYDVVILDRRRVGSGSSLGNAGWIVPSMSAPVPAPGLILTAARWLLKPDSPLAITPGFALRSAPWLLAFARNCRREPFEHGLRAMLALNRETHAAYNQLPDLGLDVRIEQRGMLFLARQQELLDTAAEQVAQVADIGYRRPRRLSAHECRSMDSALSHRIAGGIYVEEERSVRPEDFLRALRRQIEAAGVGLREFVEVHDAVTSRSRITSLECSDGSRHEVDAVVIAAGAWSGLVARRLGTRLPVQPGKGYSITIDQPTTKPSVSWDLIEERVAITPFDDALRLAGTMELSGLNHRLHRSRLDGIWRNAMPYFRERPTGMNVRAWVGMRPLTPDGLPLIGPVPELDNVYAATGHGMLGLTLAPLTGRLIGQLIDGHETDVDLTPFSPRRFGRWWH